MLQVKNVSFGYSKTVVLKAIDFKVEAGENVAIIGESGSGKSTLLKLIYGEYDLEEGQVFWKDTEILGPKYNLVIGYDFMKYVTQEFDLMPYITVEENIGKHLSRFYPEEKQKRTKELIKVVELEAFANTKVKNLSGGQKQRVALARALAKQPEILLLDEPFSHIDNFKKQSLRRSVFKYLKDNNRACIVATHDKSDVLGFADQMVVLHDKKIIAKNTPQQLYNNPELPLIASFFGEYNIIETYGIVYAHQIKIVEKSDLKAVVKQSYFNGNSWLIEALYNSESIFIEHYSKIKSSTEINIEITTL
ncbi:ABC transporter ATP-binding protein [Winogradskyella echinorum]|uniref:ABC transporter ATP-binding protein n=1 Tax=Winogradskyella echinorum TaxID=538189 RepID=A0ABR6XZB2_9FLAO|nr:ABC transporter ATP-binding protein [Winogradskyella echinorum]MBC3845821.1 ABC transporter ATP-binding protein [Winogradskyella echinorum]MBC5750169.1 ABC transporter ATP-binding protein [Winogradskyella echinorum]